MNTNNFKVSIIVWLCISTLIFSACEDEKDEVPVVETKSGITFSSAGSLSMQFNHYFKSEAFSFSPVKYVTLANDTIRITDLIYFVSNVTLTKSDGSTWNTNNFHLLDASNSQPVELNNIPAGNYTSISFLLGVDSLNNHTLNHSEPALDPATGMSWGWNTGYIFYRMKGYYSSLNKGFSYDLGGDQNLIKISFNLNDYKLSKNQVKITVKTDVNEFFENPNTYNLKTQLTEIHTPDKLEISLLMSNISQGMFNLSNVE